MTWTEKALVATLVIMLAVVAFLSDSLGDVRKERDSLSEKLSAHQVINTTTLTAVTTYHRVSLDNIKAKETEGTENVKIKTVIRTEFKDSECAVTPVPAGVTDELRRYSDGIRARAGGAASATVDR
ncbi:hypothetical protein Q4R64_11030 [Morganella morganii]|nr:hypothetical protein [Morganella morganii]